MSKHKDLTSLRLFSPLTASLYTSDEYGSFSDCPDELSPADLCAYKDKILELIQLETLTDEWCGQEGDSWGEGLEQRPVKIGGGQLYVSFWHSGRDFFIKPEQELKALINHDFTMQIGSLHIKVKPQNEKLSQKCQSRHGHTK